MIDYKNILYCTDFSEDAEIAFIHAGHEPVSYAVLAGNPHVEILRYARENQVDLITLGSMGKSETEDTHYGSTVEQVSKMAHCHVMAIRNPEKLYTL
jgi:nucleotide-binding universal stress UspA family protein